MTFQVIPACKQVSSLSDLPAPNGIESGKKNTPELVPDEKNTTFAAIKK
jgi:hypothetical protein